MGLKAAIGEALKAAMKEKDQDALRSLRAIKSAIQMVETEKGSSGELAEDQEIPLLQKLVKQRQESIEVFEQQGRNDLADKEKVELAVIRNFLPAQMSEDAVRTEIQAIISQTGAAGIKDMGKVMGMASSKLAGKTDNKLIATLARELLS